MPCVSMRLLKTQLYKETREEEAHSGDAVDGMETATQLEATWNGTVHSFDSQVLALKIKTKKEMEEKKRENGTVFSVFLVTTA